MKTTVNYERAPLRFFNSDRLNGDNEGGKDMKNSSIGLVVITSLELLRLKANRPTSNHHFIFRDGIGHGFFNGEKQGGRT